MQEKDTYMGKSDQPRRILVAGGAGFIGSNLCKRLLCDKSVHVTCIDNFSTGQLSNIEEFIGSDQFVFHTMDVTECIEIEGDIDEIYHLACPASPKQYMRDPVQTFKSSVIGSLNLLELAREKNARILLASTSEVYGDPMVPLQKEDYWGNVNPYGPRSCYDEGKRGAETLFHDYHEMYGVDTRVIRIFNTYGPGMSMDDGRVVSNFIAQALRGVPLTVYGDGMQTRSFQYIDDLVEAMMRLMCDDVPHIPINVGNPHEVSVLELAEAIIQMTGSDSEICFQQKPIDDPCRRCPDISLASKILNGWSPRVNLEHGLQATIAYFHNLINQSNVYQPEALRFIAL